MSYPDTVPASWLVEWPDWQPRETKRMPLSAEECAAHHTPQVLRLATGYVTLARRAIEISATDFELALEMDAAAELLRNQAEAAICREYVRRADLDLLAADEAQTRMMNYPR